ncbi:hypothetical protein V6N11_014133 [Hibiscus sabdariffa]|uniref:Uncharacterized protein n=2 Tax=Hibiscus sabdariffa TaxID=183260 RepID=A0ABR2AGT4_9ROSI
MDGLIPYSDSELCNAVQAIPFPLIRRIAGARPASIYGRRSCHFSFIRREERWLDWLKARPFVFFERKVEALGSRHPWNGSGGPVAVGVGNVRAPAFKAVPHIRTRWIVIG